EHAPLYEVRRWAGLPAEGPLFESLVVFENYPVDAALRSPPGLALGAVRAIELDHFPLSLGAVPGAALRLTLGFDRARFDDAFARAALARLGWLLGQMARHLDEPVGELPRLSEAERYRALTEWNPAPSPPGARPGLARELLEAQAARRPDAVAVEEGGERMTYGEWERRSNRLARALRRRGLGPDDLVALCFEPSRALLVAMLAVLKAGAGYLPLDPSYPAERRALMLRDARARLLLAGDARAADAPPGVEALAWAEAEREALRESNEAPPPAAGPASIAYVIYTSGSTGAPKGVMVSNAALCAYAEAFVRAFGLDEGERVLQLQSVSFDGSVEEIYPCLLAGGTAVVRDPEALATPERFFAHVEAERITFLDLPTALWARLAAGLAARAGAAGAAGAAETAGGLPRSLRRCVVGGEAMAAGPALAWRRRAGGTGFYNTYGPTEATVIATWCDVNALDEAAFEGGGVPLGRPLPNARAYVLDARQRLLPEGAEGEIYLGGESLARGYLGRPGLTAERFVPDPFSPAPGARMYRTGDRGRWRPDGQIEFLGRADRQLKLRGFRVEPAEIEAALGRYPDVRQALVVARAPANEGGDRLLVAYLVPAEGRALDPDALRAFARQSLPEYMVPAAFVALEALPLTPVGKLDLRALPAPGPAEPAAGRAPRGPIEELLATVWAEVLGREGAGRDESFFDLGGHSLLAMQLASRVREVFGVELSVRAAFEAPTLRALAERIARARGEPAPEPLPRAAEGGPARPSFAQERLWFLDRLHPGGSAYNVPSALRLRGPLDVEALRGALRALVERHEGLRTTFVDDG
ncbi:MAG TPA: amino acid adenylation domain-containing protein, partial [Polyangiaceae bacterium]|nr:amino acid adenylation domain-containing protein [Polyangiaceae bacterium]